jgi:hypothetical protein
MVVNDTLDAVAIELITKEKKEESEKGGGRKRGRTKVLSLASLILQLDCTSQKKKENKITGPKTWKRS